MQMLVMRHADTDWNKIGFLSFTDLLLSETGREHAKYSADKLRNLGINVVFTSPLKRAKETADIIAAELDVPVKEDTRLREVNFGIFEGLSKDEAKKKFQTQFLEREKNKWNYTIEKGESYKDASVRVEDFVGHLRKSGIDNVLVITHATLIKLFLILYSRVGLKGVDSAPIEPCSCFEFREKNGVYECKKLL